MVVKIIMRGTVTEAFFTWEGVSGTHAGHTISSHSRTYLFGHVSRAINANERRRCRKLSDNACCPNGSPATIVCKSGSTEDFAEGNLRSKHPKRYQYTKESEEMSE
jgi:hypothetical protein